MEVFLGNGNLGLFFFFFFSVLRLDLGQVHDLGFGEELWVVYAGMGAKNGGRKPVGGL